MHKWASLYTRGYDGEGVGAIFSYMLLFYSCYGIHVSTWLAHPLLAWSCIACVCTLPFLHSPPPPPPPPPPPLPSLPPPLHLLLPPPPFPPVVVTFVCLFVCFVCLFYFKISTGAGKDLSKISMPVALNEPLSALQVKHHGGVLVKGLSIL